MAFVVASAKLARISKALGGTAVLWLVALPAEGLEASRCSFDPACICIEWSWDAGSEIEIRCPAEGAGDGWARSPVNGHPDIIDPGGTFRGDGRLSGDTPQAGEVRGDTMNRIRNAKDRALTALQIPECAAFENSPLPLSGETIVQMISWLDGDAVQPFNRCDEPDGPAAYYRSPGRHVLQIYVCQDPLNEFTPGGLATLVIHEALHIAGQTEDGTRPASPSDPPNSFAITYVVAQACNLPVN